MKSSRLILVGAFLLIAGVAGFIASYSSAAEATPTPAHPAALVGEGFLPMALPVNHQAGAPTLAPTLTPTASETQLSEPATLLTPDANITPSPTPQKPLIPDRIVIEKIALDAPVKLATEDKVTIASEEYLQYLAPDEFAAGWHPNSAPLGAIGNTVINGHHNVHGKVFGRLVELVPGDRITVFSGTTSYTFQVANVLILPERDADLAARLENARWIEPSQDIRLTLVTCWPEYSNTHRLIIVASLLPDSFDRKDVQ
jgi:LPXTG-site transpeptidase (sortase) family protein